uniref:helix-turn-helix domain-containing protein n=1 Tax=Castellaniella defragrans TaxID=75697 RepID=UPI00333ED2D6
MDSLHPGPPARDHTSIPIYKLYGYGNVWTTPDSMYCETIAAQEKLHNWHVKPHKHADLFQILCLETGHVMVHLDGSTRAMNGGQMVLVPQMTVHGFQFDPNAQGYILTITYGLMAQICERMGLTLTSLPDPSFLTLGEDDESRHAHLSFIRLNQEYRSAYSPQRSALLDALLSCILAWVHRRDSANRGGEPCAATHGQGSGNLHLARFTQLIESHYRTQHKVGWYALRLGITAAHLNVITQALGGKSALQLIHERLLLEARRELIYTPRTISTISDSLGFSDPGYFTRFFKRVSGRSPKEFRRLTLSLEPSSSAAPETAAMPRTAERPR